MTQAVRVLAAALRDAGEPCLRDRRAGVDVLVARPRGEPRGTVVYANAATPRGIELPAVARLLGGLAHVGFVAVAPELPSVRDLVVSAATVDALVDVVEASGSRVGMLGVSTGASVSLLAAPRLGDGVSSVAAVAPFADLKEMLRLGTTGTYAGASRPVAPLVREMATRSLRAAAPDDAGVETLLANADPARFDELYAALAPEALRAVADLSPVRAIADVCVPVELACAPGDRFCPARESRLLARAGRDVQLTVTRSLEHVCPRPHPGLVTVLALVERLLARAADAPAPALRPALGR